MSKTKQFISYSNINRRETKSLLKIIALFDITTELSDFRQKENNSYIQSICEAYVLAMVCHEFVNYFSLLIFHRLKCVIS